MKQILIIKLAAIGDVLRTTSVLQGIKEKYTDSHISWVTSEQAYPILENNPLIDDLYTINENLIKDFKAKKFDLIINLDEDYEACKLATGLEGEVIGFYLKDNKVVPSESTKEYFDMSALGKKPKNDELKKENKKTYQQLMFDIIGIQPKKYDTILNLREDELNFAKEFAAANNIKEGDLVIGLNTGAGKRWQLKKWSIKKTAELADKLHNELKAKVLLFGGKEEKERNKEILKACKTPAIDAGCDNSLPQFAALVNLCELVVCSDSLVLHIAVALKKNLVVLFGPTSANEIELYGLGKKMVPDIDCVCCYKKECTKKPNCMDMISVEEVFENIKSLLNL